MRQSSRAAHRLVITGLVLWAVATTAYGALRLTFGQRPVSVNVRWAPGVEDATRERLEQRYGLSRGEPREGRTWSYALIERSRNNIRALVLDPAVEDTHQIHRTAFRATYSAPRLPYVTSRPWIPVGLELLTILFFLGGLAGIGVALLEIAAPARRLGPVVAVRNSFLDPWGSSRRVARRLVTWFAGRFRLASRQMRLVLFTLIGAMGAILVLVILDYFFLSSELTLPEDGFIESLSALTFLLGSVTAAVGMWTAAHRQARIVGALICASALIACLDEVSFGQRTSTFGYRGASDLRSAGRWRARFPAPWLRRARDAVLWCHDVADGCGPCGRGGGGVVARARDRQRSRFSFGRDAVHFLCACAFVLVGLIIDLDFATSNLLSAMEEMLELDTGLLLTAGAIAQIVENAPVRERKEIDRDASHPARAGDEPAGSSVLRV